MGRSLLFLISFVFAVTGEVHATPEVIFDAHHSFLALRGMVDLSALNEFLKPEAVTAVEVATGKAVVGLSIDEWSDVHWAKIPFTLQSYMIAYFGVLVNDPRGGSRMAFYAREPRATSLVVRGLYLLQNIGLETTRARLTLPESYPAGSAVARASAGASSFSLHLGVSNAQEMERHDYAEFTAMPAVLKARDGALAVSEAAYSGSYVTRGFDPNRDRYETEIDSEVGAFLTRAHFQPLDWEVGRMNSVRGFAPEIVRPSL